MTRCVDQTIDQGAANLLSTAKAGTTVDMARRKKTPDRSQIVRERAAAFARRSRTSTDGGDGGDVKAEAKPDATDATPDATAETSRAPTSAGAKAEAGAEPVAVKAAEKAAGVPEGTKSELPEIEPPAPKAEPWPDATPQPMKPVEPAEPAEPVRARVATVAMPVVTDLGAPPEIPRTTAPPPLELGTVEDPAHMPGPRDIPSGSPDDPAPPPGGVPPGDSRSLRHGNEFALVYRVGSCVITRSGTLGTRGQWRVVEYPTSSSASNSYAKECSRFVTEGFSDYRE